jgi:hypothetical protein
MYIIIIDVGPYSPEVIRVGAEKTASQKTATWFDIHIISTSTEPGSSLKAEGKTGIIGWFFFMKPRVVVNTVQAFFPGRIFNQIMFV